MSSTSAEQRSFVDTNVVLYAYDLSAGDKRTRARSLVSDLWNTRGGRLSVQVLQEVFMNLVGKLGLARTEAASIVSELVAWSTHAPDGRDVLAAIDLSDRYRISFWDAMVVRSAGVLGCDVLYTEDLNAGQSYDGVLVVNPFAA